MNHQTIVDFLCLLDDSFVGVYPEVGEYTTTLMDRLTYRLRSFHERKDFDLNSVVRKIVDRVLSSWSGSNAAYVSKSREAKAMLFAENAKKVAVFESKESAELAAKVEALTAENIALKKEVAMLREALGVAKDQLIHHLLGEKRTRVE